MRTDRQTDRHTDTLIAILRTRNINKRVCKIDVGDDDELLLYQVRSRRRRKCIGCVDRMTVSR